MAETNPAIRRFHTQKTIATRYITIEISHPSIVTRRFIRDQQTDKTFTIDGQQLTFIPLQFNVPRPSQREQEQSSISVKLGRVGSQFLEEIKKIDGFSWIDPATMIYREIYPNNEIKEYRFSISSIGISTNNVSIIATDDNPINYRVSRVYTIDQFPGLETI